MFRNFFAKQKLLSKIMIISAVTSVISIGGFSPVQAAPDTQAPTATAMTVQAFSGSHAPWDISINNLGEYCTRTNDARFTLLGVQDPSGVQGVRFHVQGWSYPNNYTQDYIINGSLDVNGNWYADLDFSVLPSMYNYTVKAFPIDNLGNSQESTMLNDNAYAWKRTIKYDIVKPTTSVYIRPTGDGLYYSNGTSDGYPAVNCSIKVDIPVSESWYSGSGVRLVTASLYKVGTTTALQRFDATCPNADLFGNGNYTANFDLAQYGNQEIKFFVRATVYDYAGNQTIVEQRFTYDKLSPQGTITISGTNPTTASTVDVYFTSRTDTTGIGGPVEFYFWTTANGQDDLQCVYGQPVAGTTNKWKATLRRDEHQNQTGEYNLHVWTWDQIGNHNFAAAKTLQMN